MWVSCGTDSRGLRKIVLSLLFMFHCVLLFCYFLKKFQYTYILLIFTLLHFLLLLFFVLLCFYLLFQIFCVSLFVLFVFLFLVLFFVFLLFVSFIFCFFISFFFVSFYFDHLSSVLLVCLFSFLSYYCYHCFLCLVLFFCLLSFSGHVMACRVFFPCQRLGFSLQGGSGESRALDQQRIPRPRKY